MDFTPIAHMHSDFPTKFGVPRQSNLVQGLRATVVFEEAYRDPNALRGLEGYSHLWLIWAFSQVPRGSWSPTVRPPRLGGNSRRGVFATRSPFRPNPIGLSCVEIDAIDLHSPEGPLIHVRGGDLMHMTPILDIKPYVPYADCRPEATGGFAASVQERALAVSFAPEAKGRLSPAREALLAELLALDPRPSYQSNPQRVYGLPFQDLEVKFAVEKDILTVLSIEKIDIEGE